MPRSSAAQHSTARARRARSSAAQLASHSAHVFAALGDEHRLRVVMRLSDEGPLSIAELTADASITRQAISKHLAVLEQAGLVKGERDGRRQVYSLERKRVQKAQAQLQAISDQWDSAIARLRAFVED
jgi:DNA-binding transcriptional ArsR family regulator